MLFALVAVSAIAVIALWVAFDMWRGMKGAGQLLALAFDALTSQNAGKRKRVAHLIKESIS